MWGSRPLPEFMDELDAINGGYGRYSRLSATIFPVNDPCTQLTN